MENTICQIEHNIFHSSNRTNRNSTCRVVNKIFHSPNRTNRPNRQACKGSLSLMRCNFRMENTICQIEHNIFHSSNRTNRTNRNSTCRVVNKIFHSPNRTNRLNRQTCKGSRSIMRCNCRIENSTCRIVQKFLYSPNRTNRSNGTSVFSDRIQLTVLDMDDPRMKNIFLRSGRTTSVHFWTMTVALLHQTYLLRHVMIFPSALILLPVKTQLKQLQPWKPTKLLALLAQLLQRLSKEVVTRWLIPSMPSARRYTPTCRLLKSGWQMSSSHCRRRVICL